MNRTLTKIFAVTLSVILLITAYSLPMYAGAEEIGLFSMLDSQKTGVVLSDEEQLLEYYKGKFAGIDYLTCENNSVTAENPCRDMLCFSEKFISEQQVTTQLSKITFTLSASDVRISYLLSSYKHSANSGIHMLSSENGDELSPSLTVYCNEGTYTFKAYSDAYIRATGVGDNNANESTAYGITDENNLWAMHCADTVNSMPYSSNEMRTYLIFDISELEGKNVQSAELSVYAEVKNPASDSEPSDTVLPLVLMSPAYRMRNESNLTWSAVKSSKALGHYSFDGLGGFIFSEELYGANYSKLGVPSGLLSAVSDFTAISALCRDEYFEKAKEYLLAFAAQTSNSVGNGGFPSSSSYEPARRLAEFPYIYKALLDNDMLSAQENYTVLNWLYKNIDYVYAEKTGKLFNSNNTPNTSENRFNSYEGINHLCGLYNSFAFFDEFLSASEWENAFLSRLNTVTNSLINSDGSYINASLDYPASVIDGFSQMLVYMNCGNYSGADSFQDKVYSLADYIVHCALPDGKLPEYGDSTGTDASYIINQPFYSLSSNAKAQNVLWYITNGEQGTEPEKSALYKNAKIATDRTGWSNDDSMIFMNAKSGGDFAHADSLALLMHAYGRNLLADTGNATSDTESPYYKLKSTTSAHNTVEVDSTAQSMSDNDKSSDNINMTSDSSASVIRAYTTSNADVTHYRNVSYIKALDNLVLVNDLLVPNGSQNHTYTQNWHSAQGANVKTAAQLGSFSDSVWGYTDFESGANLMISQAIPCGAKASLGLDAQSSSGYSDYLEFSQSGTGKVSYNTALYPYESTNGGVRAVNIPTGTDASAFSAMKIQTFSSTQLTGLKNETIFCNSFDNNGTTHTISVSDNNDYLATDAGTALFNTNQNGIINMLFVSDGKTLDIYNNGTSKAEIASVYADKKISDLSVLYNDEDMTVEIETSDSGVLDGTTNVDIILPETESIKIKNVFVNGIPLSDYENITVNGKTFLQYTVAFINYDGTTLQLGLWFEGDTPVYSGAEPSREATAQYKYTFSGWSPAITEVTENAVYTAQFSSEPQKYTVSFNANGGTCSAEPITVSYGLPYGTLPSPDARIGFIFEGWFTDADGGEKITESSTANISSNTVLYAHWAHDTFIFNESSSLIYDAETKTLYGISPSVTADNLKSAFLNTNISVSGAQGRIGTGVLLELTDDKGEVYDTVSTVVFGDVNCDGWYDSTDAVIVNIIANGMLTKAQVGDAVYMAADCNHDGAIDSFDVDLLEDAGILLASIDQSKSHEELQTESSYVQYLNIISQSVAENEPVESENTPSGISRLIGFIADIYAFLNNIVNFIKILFA